MVARRAAALALAAALATGLTACGGGDDEEGTDQVDLEDVESDASSASSEDEDASAPDEEATDDAVDDAVAGAFSEGCGEFSQVFGALGGAISGAFDAEAAEEFENFVDDAPEEIQDDLETIASSYEEFADALEEAGFDPEDPQSFDPSDPEAIQIFTEASAALSSPEFQEASTAVSEFIAADCES